ncbi:hypothetical protein PROFUN_13092 [Planoprotostelium fungivorum]|uniref:Serine hydrolase domain-containing protein n=1 Tax=Planoprotostelium fungivorum TaxID=1890364 RepID=A0A2P6N5B8_9EUKA|nr:hypothetical protein PROFUN_13092 [Planoprotostelium fungivorum]
MQKLKILVLHGQVQTASTVAYNTRPLRDALSDVADLFYAEGPAVKGNELGSRPWWVWQGDRGTDRWNDTVRWWHEHLSQHSYDGIIGLSQGSSMTAQLLSMISQPDRQLGFGPILPQPIRFAIFCSGFISQYPGHFIDIPKDISTLHTVDHDDSLVSGYRTIELSKKCKLAVVMEHHEGHCIPMRGDWPKDVTRALICKTLTRLEWSPTSIHYLLTTEVISGKGVR